MDIDYGWRQRGDPGSFPFTRYKLVLDASCNDFVEIHYQRANPSCQSKGLWNSNANDLRFNHYKQPSNGVYWKGKRAVRPPEDVERDTSLADEYRERLVEREVHREGEDEIDALQQARPTLAAVGRHGRGAHTAMRSEVPPRQGKVRGES